MDYDYWVSDSAYYIGTLPGGETLEISYRGQNNWCWSVYKAGEPLLARNLLDFGAAIVYDRDDGYGRGWHRLEDCIADFERNSRFANVLRAKARFSRRITGNSVDLIDGYVLTTYDGGQMKIRKPRPYVFGDTASALSNDGGRTWQIRMEHETAINYSFDVVDVVKASEPDFLDIVMLVKEWDEAPENRRFVDKW